LISYPVAALGAAIFIFGTEQVRRRMKNRKNLGCRIKGTKERGAWAELYFMVMAMSQGLRVSSPYGGFAPYDVGVEGGGPILRVQVKCTVFRCGKGYSINCFGPKRGPKRSGYAPGTVDYFALYIVPTDDWYIMPYAAMGGDNRTLHFTPDSEQQKYGKYQEAWHLLLEAAKGRGKKGLAIRASSEDGDEAEVSGRSERGTARVRRMFRGIFEG
jgi:PD-(D/E)XK endonuclease